MFTDEDLKRLKECLENPHDLSVALFNANKTTMERFNMTALIARLEAAEAQIKAHEKTNSCCWGTPACPSTETWRKEAGR